MGLKFRKSVSFGPLKLTVGKKGGSVSVGTKGLRVGVNSKGKSHITASIPGTGVSYTSSLGGKKKK